jgi:hypothetical protein
MNDQSRVSLLFDGVVSVIVDAMGIERQSRVTEQKGCFRLNCPYPVSGRFVLTRRQPALSAAVTEHDVELFGETILISCAELVSDSYEGQRSCTPGLLLDADDANRSVGCLPTFSSAGQNQAERFRCQGDRPGPEPIVAHPEESTASARAGV